MKNSSPYVYKYDSILFVPKLFIVSSIQSIPNVDNIIKILTLKVLNGNLLHFPFIQVLHDFILLIDSA